MAKVCILDYGSGNVKSVYNLFANVCDDVVISNSTESIAEATHIVLPGVGAFSAAMRRIDETLPMDALQHALFVEKKPFLGICVGMQVMAERGTEFGEHRGLGWIRGSVDKLTPGDLPLPHIGWNSVRPRQVSPLLDGLPGEPDFYFLHSFVFRSDDPSVVGATTAYGEEFCCLVQQDNLYGVQFHPEKSQKAGLKLIENFLGLDASSRR
jgi:glutamine amidotransferase